MSHDLRTPLAALHGYLETLQMKSEGVLPPDRREYLAVALRQSERLKRMVEERTQGAVLLGAGTLYAGLRRMAKDGLIQQTEAPANATAEPGARWRFYELTPQGGEALEAEIARLEADLEAARAAVRRPV